MKLLNRCVYLLGFFLLTLSVLLPGTALAEKAAQAVHVLRLPELEAKRFDDVVQTLQEGGTAYGVVKDHQLDEHKGQTLVLPLPKKLSSKSLSRVEGFVSGGGKLVVIPSESEPDKQTVRLFQALGLPISGSAYAPQTQELNWNATPAPATDYLPVGSRILIVDAVKLEAAMAVWGDLYPAVVKSDQAVLLNWLWGRELSASSNNRILSHVLGGGAVAQKLDTASKVLNSPSATGQPDDLALGDAEAQEPEPGPQVDYGTFFKKMRDLEDYKRHVYNNIEAAIQLQSNLDIKKAEQTLMEADVHKARFESETLSGNTEGGDAEFEKSKSMMLEALMLSAPSPKVEGRAIWLDRGSIVASGSAEGFRALLHKLDKAGINIVYLETVNAGYPIYPSSLVKQNPLIQGWDPLKVAVEEGRRLGMEVHAWVWCFAVGNQKHNAVLNVSDGYAGPVLVEKGLMSEALRMSNGGLVPHKQTEFWLSPASPKARQFLQELFSEIVTHYDVDGVHLDYIRYPFQRTGTHMGYEAVGRQRFESETGMLLGSADEYTMKAWAAWKSYQVSSFVRDVSQSLKRIRPDLKLSAAVFPMRRPDRIMAIQQDWETWVDKGWIDTLSPMSYTTSPNELQSQIEKLTNASERQVLIYPGIAILKMDTLSLLNMLDAARRKGSMGSTLFAMAHLDDEKLRALGQGPYKVHKPVSPHRDPLRAMTLMLDDYEAIFAKLAAKGELYVLGRENIEAIRKSAAQLKAQVKQLDASWRTTRTFPAGAMEQVRQTFEQFVAENQYWLDQERSAHAFRAYHFNGEIARMNQLLRYALANMSDAGVAQTANIKADE
jgi:uncharacterized lipoprotein YddW (UPF0748 family)